MKTFYRNHLYALACAFLIVVFSASANWQDQGEVALESRAFKNDHSRTTNDQNYSLLMRLGRHYKKGGLRFSLQGVARADKDDHNRNFMAFEDFYLQGKKSAWGVSLGYKIFNWTATEAFHPADVINSRNLDSDIENTEKLGEMHLSLSRKIFKGHFTLFYFPRYESPKYPSKNSRKGKGLEIADPAWIDENNQVAHDNYGSQGGALFTQNFDNIDITLHALRIMDRHKPLVAFPSLVPHYFMVWQYGGTYVQAIDDLLLKIEVAHRNFDRSRKVITKNGVREPLDHTMAVLGFEYGISHTNGTSTALFLEGQNLFGQGYKDRIKIDIFQRDIMLGLRYSFNDIQGKELFLSFFSDLERGHEFLYSLSYTQRLNEFWKLKTGIRIFDAPQKGNLPIGLESFNKDNRINFNLIRYF